MKTKIPLFILTLLVVISLSWENDSVVMVGTVLSSIGFNLILLGDSNVNLVNFPGNLFAEISSIIGSNWLSLIFCCC